MEGWNDSMMKKVIIRILIFAIIFGGALFYFNYTSTAGKTEMSTEMNQATLPILYTRVGEHNINELHGYTGEIDESLAKDTLTPSESKKSLEIYIKEYENSIDVLHYELKNASGNEIIQKGDIKTFQNKKDGKIAKIQWKKPLTLNKDYTLKMTIKTDGGVSTKYFTKVRYVKDSHITEFLEFVTFFHETTFEPEKATEQLKTYMETRTDGVNNSLNSVNIHSSMESLTFAKLKPKQEGTMQMSVKDLDGDIVSIYTFYIISAENSKKQKEYYYVTEHYRIKYGEERMYLLDFERNQEAFFNPRLIDSSKNAFKIGIASTQDIQIATSSDMKKMAMVRERQLWYYDYKNVSMTKVFSFRQDNAIELRNDYDQHDIHLIRMEEDGEIIFAVYGYMNRGRHEGACGIALYRFEPEEDTIEELLFVPSKSTYPVLKDEVNQVLYYNKKNQFFFSMDSKIYQVDCETKKKTILAKSITATSAVTSKDGSILAIQENKKAAKNKKIVLWNLNTGKKRAITAKDGTRLKNIGFVGNQLLYGIAKEKDILDKESEEGLFPMYVIMLCDKNMKQSVTYKKEGIYVSNATIDGQALELIRVKKGEKGYVETSSDIMIRKEDTQNSGLLLSLSYSNDRYNQVYLVFPNNIYITTTPDVVTTREMLFDDYRTVTVEAGTSTVQKYYVYVNGQVLNSYAKAGDAIELAAEKGGDVLSSTQQYIWQSGNTPVYGGFAQEVETIRARNVKDSKNACIAMMLQYENIRSSYTDLVVANESVEAMLSRYFGKRSVNLSGATLSQALYYVGKGSPVIAKVKEDYYILITSYNGTHIRYTDPVQGLVVKEERSKVEKMLKEKVFYSYIKQ